MMKTNITLIAAVVMLTACKTLSQNSFNVGEVNYEKMNGKDNPAIAGARVFSKFGSDCNINSASDESGAAIAVSAAAFLIKEGVAYGKGELEKKAAYLSSDVVISGSTFIKGSPAGNPVTQKIDTPTAWPDIAVANKYEIERSAAIKKAEKQASNEILAKNGKATKEQIKEAENTAAIKAGKEYDDLNKSSEFKTGQNDLCVLLVAGEYKDGATNLDAWNRLADKNGLTKVDSLEKLYSDGEYSDYKLSVPGSKDKRPFQDLTTDPSLIVELHLIPTSVKGGVMYTIKPTYLFYPYPLHKGTAKNLERKLTIELGLGEKKPTILLERMISGKQYRTNDMLSSFVSFNAEGTTQYQEVSLKVSEGPDKMPTAKILTDLAGKDKDIEKYLIDKLQEKAKKEGWVEAEAKK